MEGRPNERNDLQDIIDKALSDMAEDAGHPIDLADVNLAELRRRTGLTRSRLRTIQKNGFKVRPHANTGRKAGVTKMTGHERVADELLAKGVANSSVVYERLVADGYKGGLATVKDYVRAHMSLAPAKRKTAAPQGSRGQRFHTKPGQAHQMGWGLVNLGDEAGVRCRTACFAMICHHCGTCHAEFFPNARQENLFIGMAHAFMAMGVPEHVLTDNMKSVALYRDSEGRPVWQTDYAAFMACVGFRTKLCKPRHPLTKGKVERLVRYVKDNFLAGRDFHDITQLNEEALAWCARQGGSYHRALDCVPADEHGSKCLPAAGALAVGDEVAMCLCPRRRITFDGFVSYEGRRLGVPHWYDGSVCRVSREGECLHVYSEDLARELCVHPVTRGREDSFCEGQYVDAQPCEVPSRPVRATVPRVELPAGNPALAKFDFGGMIEDGR
ncbi:IS21 family transposase [uncultured Olsenella sp.]|uniref:IS21 family transposase n=1 Tax=uncultured Olsenella sp. TaxID=190764 RepID=UPI0026DCADE6|nr:IS21 family transposase [uncultured Olsenella sp.]